MMKVSALTSKLIKPHVPTPPSLKTYRISFRDVTAPVMDGCLVLYYTYTNGSSVGNKIKSLEESLENILPSFYPFAGRYMKKDFLVDCSDQGVEFVEAEASADVELLDVIGTHGDKHHLDDLLPERPFEIDDAGCPLLSIQVTSFRCGGIAIGVCMSHRIADGCSLGTFLLHWAKNSGGETLDTVPTFDSPSLFPIGDLIDKEMKILPKTPTPGDPGIVSKRFLFDRKAITALRNQIPESRHNTRVRLVSAFIAKTIIQMERAKHEGRSKGCLMQAVNMRGRTIPPLPLHSFGNLSATAVTRQFHTENVGIQDLVSLLSDSIHETIAECAEILAQQKRWRSNFVERVVTLYRELTPGDTTILMFSDWTKFGLHEIDFGWGKPVWTSIGTLRMKNLILLTEAKDGDGIEAWVHLDREHMPYFEQDDQIRLFTQ